VIEIEHKVKLYALCPRMDLIQKIQTTIDGRADACSCNIGTSAIRGGRIRAMHGYPARIVPTILLHFLHPWRSCVTYQGNAGAFAERPFSDKNSATHFPVFARRNQIKQTLYPRIVLNLSYFSKFLVYLDIISAKITNY
jgi:hypothetical protein